MKKTVKKNAAKSAVKNAAPKGKASKVEAPKGKAIAAPKGKANAKPQTVTGPTARQTKKGEAIALLSTAKGISLDALMEKFGWQRHTVRGFISVTGGTHNIESTSVDGVRMYRITGTK